MKIIQFRYLNLNDANNIKYKWCSRCYEMETILNFIDSINNGFLSIHNTAAGHGQIQLIFMDDLKKYFYVKNSDLIPLSEHNISKFDIISDIEKPIYDVVLNISVLEHIKSRKQQIRILNNLYASLKNKGYLICSFDIPTIDLSLIEKWVGSKCEAKPHNAVNGENSAFQQIQYKDYNFILLIIQKNE